MIDEERGGRTPVAVVTGVSGIIGAEVARIVAGKGYDVVGIDCVPSRSADGYKAFIEVDLGAGELPSFTLPVESVDCVFHVAGGALAAEVGTDGLSSDPILVGATLQRNFVSAVDLIVGTKPSLVSPATITLVSSINALADYGLPLYSSAKAALHGLTVSLAPSLAREGIRLNTVALGTVRHEQTEALHKGHPEHFEKLREGVPGGHLLSVSEAARAIVAVGLELHGAVGDVIVIDNGQLIS